MKELRIVVILTLIASLCLGLNTKVYAAETYPNITTSTIVNDSNTINDEVIAELLQDIDAVLIYEDGSIVPLETEVVIEDISTNRFSRSNEGNTYSVRSTTKIDTKSADKNSEGVTASITMQLKWTDVPGIDNILESITGIISLEKGTIKETKVQYGNAYEMARAQSQIFYGNIYGFYKDIDLVTFAPWASCQIKFEDADYVLYVSVSSSVFD